MELTGRTYIFAAACLILLAGSLSLYQQHVDAQGGDISLFGAKEQSCRSQSVRTANVRLGCQRDLSSGGSGHVRAVAGGAKMVSVGG